jgi:Ca-activated chloride channel family protein
MSRPVTVVSVPTNQTTIILALDVSGSMCANDIEPNRLIAAKDAALSFIRRQEVGTQIGIVAFAGFAELILPPTNDQQQLEEAVRNLTINRRTAIGSAILKSIDAISEIDNNVAPAVDVYSSGPAPTPVPSGAYAPAIIVLLTDGASNAGPFPLDAAEQAVERGVRVYTIGFGTAQGGQRDCNPTITNGSSESTGYNGGGFGGGGGRWRRGIDEETLQEVADMSGGTYYAPESAIELHEVFEDLPTHLIMKHETAEISFLFVALSTLLVGAAMILALVWNPLF